MELYENDWLCINNVLYSIYSSTNEMEMRKNLLFSIKFLIDFDFASFYLLDNNKQCSLSNPIGIGFTEDDLNYYIDNFSEQHPLNWIHQYPKNIVIKDKDAIPDNARKINPYYNMIKKNKNINYVLTFSLACNNKKLGVISLFRANANPDFTEKEVYIAEQLIDHISLKLYQELNPTSNTTRNSKIENVSSSFGLSFRETDVLELICEGVPTQEICNKLNIAETTLKKHLSNIYNKIGIKNRSELLGILNPEFKKNANT